MTALRPYQESAIAALRTSLRSGKRRPILVSPTGSGKTVVATEVIRMAREKSRSVLFLAPRRELIYQASERFGNAGIRHGVIMAGEPRDIMADVQIASFDTLHARGVRSRRMLIEKMNVAISGTMK